MLVINPASTTNQSYNHYTNILLLKYKDIYSDIIEDSTEALEENNKAALDLDIKEDNIEVNMEVAMEGGKIDEGDNKVGEEEEI